MNDSQDTTESRSYLDKYLDEKFDTIEEARKEAREDRQEIFRTLVIIQRDISALKVKSGLWGGISGAMSTSVLLIGAYIKSKMTGG